jgi:hypothetical protein
MKKIRYCQLLVFPLLFLFLTGFPRLLVAYERPELVDSAVVTIRVSDVTGFIDAITQSGLGQLWNSDEMKAFIHGQSLAEALKETFLHSIYGDKSNYKELAHLAWEELKLLKGELVVGFSPENQEEKSSFYIAAALDPADYPKTLEIDERMAELDEDETAPRKQVFQGVDIYRLDRTESPGVTQSEWSAFYGGTLLSSSSLEWIQRCLVRLKKQLPSIPAPPPTLHVRITNRFIENLFAQRNSPALQEAGTAGTGEKEEDTRDPAASPVLPGAIIDALGLDQIQTASLALTFKPGSLNFQFLIDRGGKGQRKGLWTLLPQEPIPPKHRLAYVPEDVYNYQVLRLDLNALWKELPDMLQAINPQLAAKFQGITGMFSGLYKVDLARDLFGNLGTLITSFSRMEGQSKQELVAWQLRSPEAMEKLLVKVLGENSPLKAQFQDYLEIINLKGHKLFSFNTAFTEPGGEPSQPLAMPGPQSTYISISVVDGALVYGPDQLVRGLIQVGASQRRNLKKTLYQNPDFTRLENQVPGDAIGYTVTDISSLLQPLLELYQRSMAARAPADEKEKGNGEEKTYPFMEFLNNLRYERLPSADFIASFFGKGMSYIRFEGDNLVSRGMFRYRVKK